MEKMLKEWFEMFGSQPVTAEMLEMAGPASVGIGVSAFAWRHILERCSSRPHGGLRLIRQDDAWQVERLYRNPCELQPGTGPHVWQTAREIALRLSVDFRHTRLLGSDLSKHFESTMRKGLRHYAVRPEDSSVEALFEAMMVKGTEKRVWRASVIFRHLTGRAPDHSEVVAFGRFLSARVPYLDEGKDRFYEVKPL